MTNLVLWAGAVLGVGLAILGVVIYRRGLVRHAASSGWTHAEATVIASSLEEHTSRDSDDNESTSYRPKVRYRYQAGGTEREGNRTFLCMRSDFSSKRDGQKWLAPFSPGATVPVWFDPANPDDAALELNKPSLVMAIVFVIIGLFLAAVLGYIAAVS